MLRGGPALVWVPAPDIGPQVERISNSRIILIDDSSDGLGQHSAEGKRKRNVLPTLGATGPHQVPPAPKKRMRRDGRTVEVVSSDDEVEIVGISSSVKK